MPERDRAARHCCIQLPDGTSCAVVVRAGLSIKEVLAGLCEQHGINGAAVDLFLVGGDKVGALGGSARGAGWGLGPLGGRAGGVRAVPWPRVRGGAGGGGV